MAKYRKTDLVIGSEFPNNKNVVFIDENTGLLYIYKDGEWSECGKTTEQETPKEEEPGDKEPPGEPNRGDHSL